MSDSIEQLLAERDKLWCAALINVLEPEAALEVIKAFNETRPNK